MKTFTNPAQKEIDIQQEAVLILKSLLLLEKPYSSHYLTKVLQGENPFGWQNDNHQHLETFGSIEHYYSSQVEDIIYFLVGKSFIHIKDELSGSLEITPLGEAYLTDPSPIPISRDKIFKAWYEIELIKKIRAWRLQRANELVCKPYNIFSNCALFQMAKELPETTAHFDKLKGIEKLDENAKEEILQIIGNILAKKKIDDETGLYRRAYSPSRRKVKELFEAGLSIEEISQRRKIKVSTSRNYLLLLHKAGEIDLVPWIEEKLDPLTLHKVNEYFKSAQDRSLKVAHNVLEIDYDTLALGRLFSEEKQLKPA